MVGLYIHIPFCLSKCKYCDFVSYTDKSDSMADYIDAVIDEAKRYQGEEANTVFIGGGTPAALPVGVKIYQNIKGCRVYSRSQS